MTGRPSGTVTFLFTDLEGSTRLWQDLPEAMQPALVRHDDIVRAAIEAHGGHVVKTTGDGFHAVFASAHDAIVAAEAGLTPEAAALTGYADAALRPYRISQPGQAWVEPRLDRALGGLAAVPSEPPRHRREIMDLVDELETVLAPGDSRRPPAEPSEGEDG